MIVHAPLGGLVVALVDVPDPVFATGMVGAGVAIEPSADGELDVTSPVDGVLEALQPHAFVVRGDPERARSGRGGAAMGARDVLVHLGIDTVGSDLFTVHRSRGDTCTVGDRVVSWRPADVVARGLFAVCPLVVLQAAEDTVGLLVEPGTRVTAGQPVLEVLAPMG